MPEPSIQQPGLVDLDPALAEAAITPEFWRGQIAARLPEEPGISGQQMLDAFQRAYRRHLADEIEQRGLLTAAEVVAALRAGQLGRFPA
ncbi:hypothetical protein [Streptomyces sp. NBC_00582]|uniref:hypothetical protein n=1 Tax=Streptomyces sp. NBC_00582 TaxID=2975783 RepID=UPI002E82327E|nr:hypothetical protein [Streptomyces sp. NBC_00582]WUB68462.1 hypothetical protein OG852_50060 [Streptomyces sp. NBC_00582]